MVLGSLAGEGPRHGHQIRRDAEIASVGEWGGVSAGGLYRELRAMEEEGLVEPVRTEQVGRRPARTVYAITDEGRRELRILWERAILELRYAPDALGVALLFGGCEDRSELTELLATRRQTIATSLERLSADRARGEAKGYLPPVAAAVMRRGELHLEAELAWHEEFARVLDDPPTPPRSSASSTGRAARPAEVVELGSQPAPRRGRSGR